MDTLTESERELVERIAENPAYNDAVRELAEVWIRVDDRRKQRYKQDYAS